jgi:hypothetical protein
MEFLDAICQMREAHGDAEEHAGGKGQLYGVSLPFKVCVNGELIDIVGIQFDPDNWAIVARDGTV